MHLLLRMHLKSEVSILLQFWHIFGSKNCIFLKVIQMIKNHCGSDSRLSEDHFNVIFGSMRLRVVRVSRPETWLTVYRAL